MRLMKQLDKLMSIGGPSETFNEWEAVHFEVVNMISILSYSSFNKLKIFLK